MTVSNMNHSNRVILNVLSNYGGMILEMLAALVVTPVVLRELTREGFGLASMLLAAVGILQLISQSLGRALQRYIPQSLAQNDQETVNRIFNTAYAGYLVIGITGAAATFFFQDWLIDTRVRADLVADARIAFWILLAWFAVGFPGMIYRRGLEAVQRYDLDMINASIANVLRAVVLIVVFQLGYGSISVFIAAQVLTLALISWMDRSKLKRVIPALVESVRFVDRRTARHLTSFSVMILVIALGGILAADGFRLFVGNALGMRELGGFAAVMILVRLVNQVVNNFTTVLVPTVSSLDSRGESNAVSQLLITGSKYTMLVAVLMCMVPLPVAGSLLAQWLGRDFAGLNSLAIVLLAVQVPLAMASNVQPILMGLGRLSFLGPATLIRGVAALLAAWLYVRLVTPSVLGATASLYLVQVLFGLGLFVYAIRTLRVSVRQTVREVIVWPLLVGLIGMTMVWGLSTQLGTNHLWELLLSLGTGEIICVLLIFTIGLSIEERSRMLTFATVVRVRLAGTTVKARSTA